MNCLNFKNSVSNYHRRSSNNNSVIVIIYLNEDPVGLRNSLEQVIGGPTDSDEGVSEVIVGHHVPEFQHAPRQHCGGECHRKTELDVITGVIVPAGEIRIVGPPVTETRVSPPAHPLLPLLRQETRSLPLEEKDRFRQCVSVVVLPSSQPNEQDMKQGNMVQIRELHFVCA